MLAVRGPLGGNTHLDSSQPSDMSEGSRRSSRRLAVAEEAPNERRPLLSRLYTDHGENGDPIYSCRTDPHSHLPVYTNIHRIRRDITAVVEDYLSLQQLTDVKINVTVVRPLVDKFYNLEDISIGG